MSKSWLNTKRVHWPYFLQRVIGKFRTWWHFGISAIFIISRSKTISEQKGLLEQSSTRKVLRQIEIDSASLFVNRDTASFISNWTDNLSKLSATFSFDRELFVSKVYERALRGSVKEALRQQQSDTEAIRRSRAIDRDITRDRKKMIYDVRGLLLGDDYIKN